jgi:protein-tyrosine-phosphatase
MTNAGTGPRKYSAGGYKRAARLLFVSNGPTAALAAVTLARSHARWFEARAAALRPGPAGVRGRAALRAAEVALPRRQVQRISRSRLAWADLVLTLDDTARKRVAGMAPGRPARHVAAPHGRDWERWCRQMERRLAGMAGGMRMMARSR